MLEATPVADDSLRPEGSFDNSPAINRIMQVLLVSYNHCTLRYVVFADAATYKMLW